MKFKLNRIDQAKSMKNSKLHEKRSGQIIATNVAREHLRTITSSLVKNLDSANYSIKTSYQIFHLKDYLSSTNQNRIFNFATKDTTQPAFLATNNILHLNIDLQSSMYFDP